MWEAVEVSNPRLVIVEKASLFGRDAAVVVPHAAVFDRCPARAPRKSPNAYYGESSRRERQIW